MAQDWDIKSRSPACEACHAEFTDKQAYFSALTFGLQGYARTDFCEVCWRGKSREVGAFSSWHGVFRLPPPKPEEPLKKETAETLLRRLIEEDDAPRAAVIYILAVMLERKRVLEERDVREHEGATLRVYEHKKTGETFIVRDPGLRLDQLEEVQGDVIRMLDGQGTPGADADPAEPGAGA